MSGALINLVSKGVQDAFITGDPQVSFFRQNYKRHTNFAMKPVEINGIGVNGPSAQLTFKVENKGDLLAGMWLDLGTEGTIEIGGTPSVQIGIANTPTSFELWVGGKMIDRQDAFYIDALWSKFLSTSSSKSTRPSLMNAAAGQAWFPLHFFHCDNSTTPLPLVALQYQEVEIRINQSSAAGTHEIKMYGEYIQLDTTERQWFTEQGHDMLITQVQRIQADVNGSDLIYLNHPVKALMWGEESNDPKTSNVQLYVNGTQYFNSEMFINYFNQITPYYHSESTQRGAMTGEKDLFMFPFGMEVNRHQPTGTLNFSRVDNAKFVWSADASPLYLYAVNYNIFRIESGLGGVRFSN